MEGFDDKPKNVRNAMKNGDKAALSAMGAKGADIRMARKEVASIEQERRDIEAEIQHWEEIKSMNLHLVDADGEDQPDDTGAMIEERLASLKERLSELS